MFSPTSKARERLFLHRYRQLFAAIVLVSSLILGSSIDVQATHHLVRIDEIMAGLNGDSDVQFIEMEINIGQNQWATGGVGHVMLVFFDRNNVQTGRFVFTANAPDPGNDGGSVLIGTQAFADTSGLQPDFIMPAEIMAISGRVCYRQNPDNPQFNIMLCVSYGDLQGVTGENSGNSLPALPIMGTNSLKRIGGLNSFGGNSNTNEHFILSTSPEPRNSAGQTFTGFAAAPAADQGRTLYLQETFAGNGRTCGSCHLPQDGFGIAPASLNAMKAADPLDPLFISEFNLNTLVLTGVSQPSDLRGDITDASGNTARIHAGTRISYTIFSGQNLSGVVTDENGNSGTVQSVAAGDLDQLENPTLMTGGRVLFLENPNGFGNPPVFRESLHNLNLNLTSPFGHSSAEDSLQEFAMAAVAQHNPRTMARQILADGGSDFRMPTTQEALAMQSFMLNISGPKNLDDSVMTEAQKRGRTLFFGNAQCSACHGGNSLSEAGPGSDNHFNTGVAQLSQNASLPNNEINVRFNSPTMWDIRDTAPYFHANEIDNLRDAVLFYNSNEFRASTSGVTIPALNDPQNVDDLVAFLDGLVEIPATFDRSLTFGVQNVQVGPSAAQQVTIQNTGNSNLTLSGVQIAGTNAANFAAGSASPSSIGPGASATIDVTFDPDLSGLFEATLEAVLTEGNGRSYAVGVALSGLGAIPNSAPILITSVTPISGTNNTQTTIQISGSGFTGTVSAVLRDSSGNEITLSNVVLVSNTISATVPSGLTPGLYDLLVRNPASVGGEGAAFDAFTVIPNGGGSGSGGGNVNTNSPLPPVYPDQGIATLENVILLSGSVFDFGSIIHIGDFTLASVFIHSRLLEVTVPAGLAEGTYDVIVENLDGTTQVPGQYTILAGGIDDLWASPEDLWVDGGTIGSVRAGQDATIGLIVRRIGGKNALIQLPVEFYLNSPGGQLLGTGLVDLSPREETPNVSTSEVNWTPDAPGIYRIYAVIDPNGAHTAETRTDNNIIERVIEVLEGDVPGGDLIAPRVSSFVINNDTEVTAVEQVNFSVQATDEGGSGVQAVYFVEYDFNANAGVWVPKQRSEWIDFNLVTAGNYTWNLFPTPGISYVQAWASDTSQNISQFAFSQKISYMPPDDSETLGANESHFYLFDLNEGDTMRVTVKPIRVGDPDLYIWPPETLEGVPPYVSNLEGDTTEFVEFTVPAGQAGEYGVEVYGFTYSVYQIEVEITPAFGVTAQRSMPGPRALGGRDEDKPNRDFVGVPAAITAGPDNRISPTEVLELPGGINTPDNTIYLPLVGR